MDYYAKKLSGARLKACYDLADPRIEAYLESEIDQVKSMIRPNSKVLELGCGYGRILFRISELAKQAVGIDTSRENLSFAEKSGMIPANCRILFMDAIEMTFPDNEFDLVLCLQNGICSFRVDQVRLVQEAIRVVKPGGRAVFSSYSEKLWPARLNWFEIQAREGLIGPIDHNRTNPGKIICKDGLELGTFSREDFMGICSEIGLEPDIYVTRGLSLFCEIEKPMLY